VPEPYREAKVATPDPYLVAWADLRRRLRRFDFVVLVSVWMTAFVFGCLVVLREGPLWENAALSILPMSLSLMFLVHRIRAFRCPACGARSWWESRSIPETCAACGVVVGSPRPIFVRIDATPKREDSAPGQPEIELAAHDEDAASPATASERRGRERT
jgi:hypothetical protein